jgi:plasmid stabilization system protein ParE
MALKLRLDRQAKHDLIEIRGYLLAHAGEAAAQRVRKHLRARMEMLQRMPLIGVATSEPGIRRCGGCSPYSPQCPARSGSRGPEALT